jgi:hypothetical protein
LQIVNITLFSLFASHHARTLSLYFHMILHVVPNQVLIENQEGEN